MTSESSINPPRGDRPQIKPMRSITTKLALGFLVVGILGVALSGLFIRFSTQRAFDRFLGERARFDFVDRLAAYYESSGGWHGLPRTLESGMVAIPDNQRPAFIIIDAKRRIVYSQDDSQIGETFHSSNHSWEIPIRVGEETVGWVYTRPDRPSIRESPEESFLAGVTNATLYSGFTAAVIAIIVGIFLARSLTRPIRELTAATHAVAKGKLDQQVTVRTHDELGELAASFNLMSADLTMANELRRQMTADIAHELRTPLSVILGYTEALAEDKLPGSPQAFDAIHTEALHLQRLIEALRTLSLADAGELPLMKLPVAADTLLNRVASAYAPQARQHQITIEVQVPSDKSLEITVDADRMVQVLSNLVSNALRYTPAGGKIILAAEPHAEGIRLSVRDTGKGIDEQDLPYIFERFYRGDKSRQSTHGDESGLGLAIARSIVEAHSGTLSAESTPGRSTTFRIDLPLTLTSSSRQQHPL